MEILKVTDKAFQTYGKVIQGSMFPICWKL